MNFSQIVANWTLLYIAELLSFSLALLLLLNSEIRRPIIIWILSNIFSALAMLAPSAFVETDNSSELLLVSFLFSTTSTILPYFAVNYQQSTSSLRGLVFTFILAAWLIAVAMPYGWLCSVIFYAAGSLLVLVCAWATYKNPLWNGLRGHYPLVGSFIACAALILWRGMIIFLNRDGHGFSVNAADSATGMRLLVFVSFMLQISFISVVIGRDLRRRRIKDRLAARQFEVSRAIAEEQHEMQAVADERLDMISLLTHEVRQPINNAQASLEALDREMKGADTASNETRHAIARAQTVLDDVTLSISNAILGVSLIEHDHSIQTTRMDATEIAEFARSDCPAEQRKRILISRGDATVFADLDPVLIRLALRNLFDNAIKYSPPQSAISMIVVQDDQRLGASFKITNQITDTTRLSEAIFRQRVRANDKAVEGSGHGLFLVKKVADAHHGSISFSVHEGTEITFDLFIPD